jgi:hypothetical protein
MGNLDYKAEKKGHEVVNLTPLKKELEMYYIYARRLKPETILQ